MTYPGGKAGAGVFHQIINQIPPHRVYIEAFCGGGAILKMKRPALANIAIDADTSVCLEIASLPLPGLQVINRNALEFLRCYPWQGDEFVYCDPPYLMETRRDKNALYDLEFATEEQHRELLSLLRILPVSIALSGYWSALYAECLQDWRTLSFPATTRGGRRAMEWLWMNYTTPVRLHDYRYLGSNFREREKINRKKARWKKKFATLSDPERYAMLSALDEVLEPREK